MTEKFQDCPEDKRKMFLSAYNTITEMEMWDFMRTYNPPENKGFMFDSNPTVAKITSKIAENFNYNHSGFSMAITMRKMEEIAKENSNVYS